MKRLVYRRWLGLGPDFFGKVGDGIEEVVGGEGGELLAGQGAGGDADDGDVVFLGGADVVQVIADEVGLGVGGRLFEGFGYKFGAGFPHFSEGAEGEVRADAGAGHFVPADAGEVAGDEAAGDAGAVQAVEEGAHAGGEAVAEVRA